MQTGSELQEAPAPMIAEINTSIQQGNLRDTLGRTVSGLIQRGLVNDDASVLYPIVDGVIQMMRDEAIPLAQLKSQTDEASNE